MVGRPREMKLLIGYRMLVVVGGLLAAGAWAGGAETAETSSPELIAELIQQLGDDDYAVRDLAERRLAELGFSAFDALTEAVDSDDLEVASRAEYLLRRLRVAWTAADDAPAVRRLLEDYEELDVDERRQRIGYLARLPASEGLGALCRLVRFERSVPLAKRAALAILELQRQPAADVAALRPAVLKALDQSPRPAAQWVRTAFEEPGDPAELAERWGQLIDAEFAVWEQYPEQTQPEILATLLRRQVEVWKQVGDEAQALEAMRRIVQLEPGHTHTLLVLLDWLIEQRAWPLVDEVADRFSNRFSQEPLLIYVLADAFRLQGQSDQAAGQVARAQGLFPEDQQSHLNVGVSLQDRGWIDWAVEEYRRGIAAGPATGQLTLRAQRALAELLHDQERHAEAAEVLEVCFRGMQENARQGNHALNDGREPEEVASRRLYFLACEAAAAGDAAKQRQLLDAGLAQSPLDTEILIALYRLSADDPPHRESTVKRIQEAVKGYRQQIEEEPDYHPYFNQLAWLVANTEGDQQEALRCSLRSLELLVGESRAGYLDTLARCYFALGNLEQAVKYQSQAAQLEPYQRQIARQLSEFRKAAEAAGIDLDAAPAVDTPSTTRPRNGEPPAEGSEVEPATKP